ncbi:hypothetical protein [Streptomyces phytophilus]|uniref:hypothetical protein n=1 Tax=Streptomyces phytophilus TaxID=722715 RepID=UPI0015F0BB5E|nr:hypothetical protein [Streptomyces phytophilus]
MIEIELDIFSGRPNPRWHLSAAERNSFLQRALEGAVPMAPASVSEGKLGYRGFLVRATGDSAKVLKGRRLPTFFRVRDGLAASVDPDAEAWLLDSAEPRVDERVEQAAAETIRRPAERGGWAVAGAAACTYWVTSSTNFDFWNADSNHRLNNNCYNYASNWRTNSFAQPGRGTGQQYSYVSVGQIRDAALRDGWRTYCDGGNLYVAFATWLDIDYHWWRRTESVGGVGRWCHKPGSTPARNYDESGYAITDPYTANRGNYTTWGGYMYGPDSSRQTVW